MRIIKSLLVIGLCLAFAGPALAQPGGGQGMGRTRPGHAAWAPAAAWA